MSLRPQSIFYDLLYKVWRIFQAHGQTFVFIFTKRCDNNIALSGLIVKLNGMLLHRDIKFGKNKYPVKYCNRSFMTANGNFYIYCIYMII